MVTMMSAAAMSAVGAMLRMAGVMSTLSAHGSGSVVTGIAHGHAAAVVCASALCTPR